MHTKPDRTGSAERRAKRSQPRDLNQKGLGAKQGALLGVIDETVRLHFRLGALLDRIHPGHVVTGVLTAGRRAILRNLVELGPKTVSHLAKMRPVARQYIQVLVNGLREDGLVELKENPAHKRSKLARITKKGRSLFNEMLERERPAGEWLADEFTQEELEAAYAFLQRFRQRVDRFPQEGEAEQRERRTNR